MMEQRSRDASSARPHFCANVVLLRLICSAARPPENVVGKTFRGAALSSESGPTRTLLSAVRWSASVASPPKKRCTTEEWCLPRALKYASSLDEMRTLTPFRIASPRSPSPSPRLGRKDPGPTACRPQRALRQCARLWQCDAEGCGVHCVTPWMGRNRRHRGLHEAVQRPARG